MHLNRLRNLQSLIFPCNLTPVNAGVGVLDLISTSLFTIWVPFGVEGKPWLRGDEWQV